MALPLPAPPPASGLADAFSGFWSSWVVPQFGEQAIWFRRITLDMPGAAPTPAFDPKRAVAMSFMDGTFGVGLTLGDRMGYLAPVYLDCAKNDVSKIEEVTAAGLIVYQGPVVLYQPPPALAKFDVLVFSDGRYVVGDAITPAQVMGQTIISGAKLEARSAEDIVQLIPLQ